MADVLHPLLEHWSEQEVEDGEVINRAWQVRQHVTLSSSNQERGDIVNGTTYYEILSSSVSPLKGISQKILRVKGFRSDLWSGVARTGTFRELLKSRLLRKSRNSIQYTRRWECDDTDIKEGDHGWAANTDSSGTASQSTTTLTGVSGTAFYPAMIGLTITLTGETNVIVTGYTSTTSLTVTPSQTVSPAVASAFRGALPAEIGDAYGSGTWTTTIQPACVSVDVNPAFTVKRSLITALYSAPRRR